jgi:hypothetical protein
MQHINDNLLLLSNGEPRNVLDEKCRKLGIPNTPKYIDAIEAYGEKRLIVLSAAAAHFLADRKLAETQNKPQKEKTSCFKKFLSAITGKRGELKIFKPKMKAGE